MNIVVAKWIKLKHYDYITWMFRLSSVPNDFHPIYYLVHFALKIPHLCFMLFNQFHLIRRTYEKLIFLFDGLLPTHITMLPFLFNNVMDFIHTNLLLVKCYNLYVAWFILNPMGDKTNTVWFFHWVFFLFILGFKFYLSKHWELWYLWFWWNVIDIYKMVPSSCNNDPFHYGFRIFSWFVI